VIDGLAVHCLVTEVGFAIIYASQIFIKSILLWSFIIKNDCAMFYALSSFCSFKFISSACMLLVLQIVNGVLVNSVEVIHVFELA
jgi:hypothetical protein